MHKDSIISNLILKLQLVALGGLMLAELPEPTDQTRSQLSGGIMSAIMSFSKEVHNKEIEALSYADRSIIFIPINDFTIVAEVSSTVSKENLTRLIEEFRVRTELYFIGLNSDGLGVSEAEQILNQIYRSDWLEETITGLGYQRPLIGEERIVIKFNHQSLEYNLIEGPDNSDLIKKVINMINFHSIDGPVKEDHCAGFLMVPTIRKAIFLVHFKGETNSDLGLIIVPSEKASKLFRLTHMMQLETDQYHDNTKNPDLVKLMKQLSQIRDHDAEYDEKLASLEAKKLNFLEDYVKDVDKILPQVVVGNSVLVVGDEEIVDEVIMGLHHFGEHIVVPHIRWLTGGDEIGNGLTGLSHTKLKELKDAGKVPEGMICIDTDSKKFDGQKIKSNKFLKELFKSSKNLPRAQASEIIKNQLYIIVSFAMTGTSYAFNPKSELLSLLQDMKGSIKDNSQYELIQNLIEIVNPWIKAVINEVTLDDVWI
ncbi:MAG: hypothetical protein HeimC2_25260 [Candidatus Heimdallarchaeota archaeon LC_2]|nr:MAG: hypothetical protein HeimC2_25260 [Candidatus Heimdallarchaeota archaeon LC_2]